MKQSDWFRKKFRDWEESTGSRQSEAAWSRWLGVKQGSLNRWVQGDAKPEGENLRILAAKLGPEIYEIVGMPPPVDDPLASLPGEFGDRLRAAIADYKMELSRLGVSDTDSRAADILGLMLERHGWHLHT